MADSLKDRVDCVNVSGIKCSFYQDGKCLALRIAKHNSKEYRQCETHCEIGRIEENLPLQDRRSEIY
jgi:hypothetical protein